MKTVIEIPEEAFNEIKNSQQRILRALEELKVLSPPEYILYTEFMNKTKVGKTRFFELVNANKVRTKKVGRKLYVLAEEVSRYFHGELA